MQLFENDRNRITRDLKAAVDQHCIELYDDGFRKHLGASLIGEPCTRYLWYTFRWAIQMQYRGNSPEEQAANHGRMQRLFNRGHQTEERFAVWLRGIGCTVRLDDPETGNQYRITDVEGHFGGSTDGEIELPAWSGYKGVMLLEFKTHNNKSFVKLMSEGVKKNKPRHYAQMNTYGAKRGYRYALYCAINKNDDDIYFEIVELDHAVGMENVRKAEYVIRSQTPPPRISEVPTDFTCKFCDAFDVCHQGGAYVKNCRSCAHAQPTTNKQWGCAKFQQIIPDDFIAKGCDHWHPIGRASK